MGPEREVQNVAAYLSKAEEFETSIQQLNAPLAGYLDDIGLPTDGVLMPLDERAVVIRALEGAVSVLNIDERLKAHYISKFAVAASVGLFDAALNYLWNETVGALRRLASSMDLSYFFDVAEKRDKYRQKLQSHEDLAQIDDHTLVSTCARVGLINEVNRERLHHVNYMRNHASAAHPNQSDLNGAEMVSWLTNCLRYDINATPDSSAIEVQRLLHNIRECKIPDADIGIIGDELSRLSQERADDFLWTVFGTYVDPGASQDSKRNIEGVSIYAWRVATEEQKYAVGGKVCTLR